MASIRQRVAADLGGVHLALNVFIATSLLWLVVRKWACLNPIWAINAILGCATGLLFLLLGDARDWKLPMALATTAFLSSYIVRVPVMWRQAPITAAIVVASGIEKHSETASIEIGLRRVAEVLFGCLMGLGVTWVMSKIWRLPDSTTRSAPVRP